MEIIRAQPGQRFTVDELGITVLVGLNDDGQPTVAITTEDMPPRYVYDEATGLPGTASPYTFEQDMIEHAVVRGPTGSIVARHFPQPDSAGAHRAARRHCAVLNDEWSEACGMPDVQVLLGDAVLYDSEDHNPALRERRREELTTP